MRKRRTIAAALVFGALVAVLSSCGPAATSTPGSTSPTSSVPTGKQVPPEVATLDATKVTVSSAQLNCNLTSLGTATSVNVTFQYGTSPGVYVYETSAVLAKATGTLNANLGVYAYQTYYYRVKAAGQGVDYGDEKTFTTPPPIVIDQNKSYTATIKTNFGDIEVQLFPKEAPLAANNFIRLAREGFYNNVKFHRVVKGFVIQSGDPTGTGTGGPGYKFVDELVTRDYIGGTLAMANSGANTNGSQFFICLANLTGRLAKDYTIFGIVTTGMDVVQKIGNVPVKYANGELSSPTVDVHIDTVVITEK